MTLRIVAPHFVAAVTFTFDHKTRKKVVALRAPILHYMKGWTEEKVRDYCTKNNWKVQNVADINLC